METLTQSIEGAKVFAPATQKKVAKLGLVSIRDLLLYFPRKYLDFSNFSKIKDLKPDTTVTLKVNITEIKNRFAFTSRKTHTEALVSDDTGHLKVIWFNQAYVAKVLSPGQSVYLAGKVDYYKGLQMANPSFEILTDSHLHTGRLVPVYKLPEWLYDKTFRRGIYMALKYAKGIPDPIPTQILANRSLPSLSIAVKQLHFPSSKPALAKATERLAYEESLVQQLAIAQNRLERQKYSAPEIPFDQKVIKKLVANLPFVLTLDQKKTLWQILQDLEFKAPMNRLLLGDVGSGKTIVSFLAALETALSGSQVAFLVPTEILAMQHYANFCLLLKKFKIPLNTLFLYTASKHQHGQKTLTKNSLHKKLATTSSGVIIGTHALLQEKVQFQKLSFVVIDEQHRFGVKQRSHLLKQLDQIDKTKYTIPHLLSMSATPIPRTLALSIYSDLEVSTIREKPKERKAIKTWVIPEVKRAGAYNFIKEQIQNGSQAFIITPLVAESEKLTVKAATTEFAKLQTNVFKNLKMGLLHGSLKPKEKEAVMQGFKEKSFQILVATSIIEVGIDIENATVMLIENADRFGLAQLHQLRGRIGRGSKQAFCFVFTENQNPEALERLQYFAQTTDGFKLAEYDLKKRGFGSFFSTEQTGFNFKYPEYLTQKLLETAKQDAALLVKTDPTLSNYPLLLEKVAPLTENLHLE